MDDKSYLRPKDVERIFGVPENTQKILRWRAVHGKDPKPIPFIKRGRSVLYCRSAIERWLESQAVPVPD